MDARSRSVVLALACAGVGASAAMGVPYASQISISGNTVTFSLNELADVVTVTIGGATQNLATGAGFQSFVLPTPTTPFSIRVDKNSAAGWTTGQVLQVGTDTATTTFGAPRGVAVNQNPGPYFGRVYVTNDTAVTPSTSGSGVVRPTTGAGVYVLNADQTDAVGQGDTALDPVSGGAWGAVVNTPWHVEVGPDNNVYVSDAGATSGQAGTLWRLNPDASGGTNALFGLSGNVAADATNNGHGRIYGSALVKIDGTGGVTVLATDGDLNNGSGFNAIQQYSLGVNPTGAPGAPVPVTLIGNPSAAAISQGISGVQGVTTDLAAGSKDGRLYYAMNRSAGAQPGLFVVDPGDGSILWDSLTETKVLDPSATVDKLVQTRSVAVSPDNKYVAMISDNNTLRILPLTGPNGLPDLANMIEITTGFPTQTVLGRDLAFDAAGNLYAVSSGNAMMRVLSPGGLSSFTTWFNSQEFGFEATRITGDTNGDGVVDLGDLNNVLNNFGDVGRSPGDDNRDATVDLGDLNNVLNNFGNVASAASLSAVPEPGSAIVVCGALLLAGRRRRS